MVQVDLNVKDVVSLSVDMNKERYKTLLEKFEKKDFISYFLDEHEQAAADSSEGDLEDEY